MAQLSPYQRDVLIRTALGEARGEGQEGMADVIQVILNRANSGQYPSDPAAVALQPKQFSTWNKGEGGNNPQQFKPSDAIYKTAEQALEAVISGSRPDYTGGSLDYHAKGITPYWASSKDRYGTVERNGHIFYPRQPVPPGEIPNVVASQTDTQRPGIVGTAQRPTSAASQQFPTRSSTPRISPEMDGVFVYTPPELQRAQITPGLGSLTPDFFKRNVPLPQPRPERPQVQTASVTAPPLPRLDPRVPNRMDLAAPPLPATPRRLPDIGSTSSPVGPGPTSLATVQDMYGRPAPSRQDPVGLGPTSLASVQDMYGRPSGVGQPPATRSVASVPVPGSQPGPTNGIGSMPSFAAFQSDFGSRAPAVPQMAVPGPNAMPKGEERLMAGIYPMPPVGLPSVGVGTALDVVPGLPGFPPMPRPRPARPQPMPQRSLFGMPTPVAQRPNPNALKVAVNGAGSYGGGSSGGSSGGGSQPRFVMAATGKEVKPQTINWFNPDAPDGGAFEKRTVYR